MQKEYISSIIRFIKRIIIQKKKYIRIYFLGIITGMIFLLSIIGIFVPSKKYLIKNPLITFLLITTSLIINFLMFQLFIKNQRIIDINDTLENLEKEKEIKESLFQLNHEIKNPLAVVNGYLDMIDRTNDKKRIEKYQEIIKKEIKRSITIINDFSSFGRLKEIDKEPLDLDLVFEDIIYTFSPLLKKNNGMIHYENEDEIYINGDYDRLKQGFINLIKNSIESKDKDFLIIDIKIKKLKKHYKIYVTDNGRGMNSEVLNHIGEPFYSTKQTGTGIGMAYVKKIIELHKGKISYKSKEKEGTTVVVTLPLLD